MGVLLAPVLVVALLVATDLWVLADARRWARAGQPVVLRLGTLRVDTPEAWAALCLVLFVIFVPVYAVARRS